ncbi:phage portal protein [uncultured Arthrobacter sp.]|uniref:phage portal protein n=1 Tax=uncultured Arthrobacter sp. TaxID=114050 RepID=UPI0025E4AE13|nr:phage portal protein [uncultured Arthrobacter sp.]
MTHEKITLPGVSDDDSALINGLVERLDAKAQRNLLRASYYDGKRAIRQVGTIIPPQYYRLGIVLGWSAKAVDILARRCNLDTFVWPDGELDSIGLEDVIEGNHLGQEVSSALVSSLIHGTSFLVNTLGDESAGEPRGLIHVKDALSATGEWNPRTRRMDNLLSITDRDADGKTTGLALYLDGVTLTAEKDGGVWSVERSDHNWGVPVEPMVYKPRVGRPFGSSRISRPVMSLHDQALRTVIRMEGHADVYSFPEMWLLGADESIFKNADGSQKASWQVMLGRLKGIPDDEDAANPRADVKQFAASSPQPHIDQLKQQAQLFSGETSIPLTSLGVSDMSNPTSADSYIASREDLIAEAEGATDDWTPPLRRAVLRSLAMTNGLSEVPLQWRTVAPKWRSPLHLSRAAQADAGVKQLSAVPWLAETEVGLELLGLSEQQIQRALADRRRVAGTTALSSILERAAQVNVDDDTDPAA